MERKEVQEFLQSVHEKELRELRIFKRKDLHAFMTDDMSYDDKRMLIRAWQASYLTRLNHVWKHQSFDQFIKSRQSNMKVN